MNLTALQLLTQCSAIAIHQINQKHQLIASTLDQYTHHSSYIETSPYLGILTKQPTPRIHYINENEIYGHFYFEDFHYIIGPILHHPLLTLKDHYHLSFYQHIVKTEWQKLTSFIPVMSTEAFIPHLKLAYYLITEKKCPEIMLPTTPSAITEDQSIFEKNNIELGLCHLKEVILKKDLTSIASIPTYFWHGYRHLLSLDEFRQPMYVFISILTHCCEYAYMAHANLQDVTFLKDSYVRLADEHQDAHLLIQLFQDFLYDLIQLVPSDHYSLDIQRCLDYIQHHLDEKLSSQKLSEICHLSRSYLCVLFKQETGQTLAKYILSLRIKEAQKALLKDEEKIVEIAERLGFTSQSHFTQQFKKATQMTPLDYRQKNKHP